MIKDENYIVIHGWMINKLKLDGIELNIFALIYGFTQDGVSEFCGSLPYICAWFKISKPTAINALKSLVKKNLLIKTEIEKSRHLKECRYKVNQFQLNILIGGSKEILPPQLKNFTGGGKKILPNKEYINNTNYISANAKKYNSFPQNHYDFGALEDEFLANK